MDIKNIQKLAGITPAKKVAENPEVVTEFYGIRMSQEVEFKQLAKAHGASKTVLKDAKGRTTGLAIFNESTRAESEAKSKLFAQAWTHHLAGTTPPPAIVEETAVEEPVEVIEPVVETQVEETPIEAETVETEEVVEPVVETGNNNFLQPVEDPKNELNDRMGVNKDRSDKVKVPADVKKAVSARIAELKAAIDKYDEKGYNDQSQKQKAIECLEKLTELLASADVEGLKQAQIYYGTLMNPITDLFPASLITFLGVGGAVKEDWLDKLKEGVGYTERRGLLRQKIAKADLRDQVRQRDIDDSDPSVFGPADDDYRSADSYAQGDGDDDAQWQSSYGSCFDDGDYDESPPGFYEYTEQCQKCGRDNAISPAHVKFMPLPMCNQCEFPNG